jgi:hypothetical protein
MGVRRRRLVRAGVPLAGLGLALSLGGCGTAPAVGTTTAAPPTVICATTLSDTAAGRPVVDEFGAGTRRFPWVLAAGEDVVVRVVRGCPSDEDVRVTVSGPVPRRAPTAAANVLPSIELVREATLVTDGRRPVTETIAVLVRALSRGIAYLVVHRAHGPTTIVRLAITGRLRATRPTG